MILGIGTDIIEINRVAKADIDKLSKRILTPNEREFLIKHKKNKLESLAGRFAAKEAVVKALGIGIGARCSFLDIEILNDASGIPKVFLSKRVLSRFQGALIVHLSISHSDNYAIATATAESIR